MASSTTTNKIINKNKNNIQSTNANAPVFVSKETMRRIISDIKDIRKNPLSDHGIYYEHDETDMLCGKAMIIGPKDTPYADGFYLFKLKFPTNYPHTPPKVEFCTSDGVTRFNPNLYRCGKVCLSILNTWQGDQWSGCQTLSSVLLAICTVLNNEPLLNEPGFTRSSSDFNNYNEIIKYKNIEAAILGMLDNVKNDPAHEFALFGDIMHDHFQKNKEYIRQRVEKEIADKNEEGCIYSTSIYHLSVIVDYKKLLILLKD